MHLVTSEYTCFDLPPTLHPSAGHWHRLILDEIFQSALRMWTKGEVPESEMCYVLECMCVCVFVCEGLVVLYLGIHVVETILRWHPPIWRTTTYS